MSLFNKAIANELPSRRLKIDYKINLLLNIESPSKALYRMFKNELKILNKTLKDYLFKNFIRAFKSSTTALILFIKKPEEELRFYVDYRDLNIIIIKNRYLILLI